MTARAPRFEIEFGGHGLIEIRDVDAREVRRG